MSKASEKIDRCGTQMLLGWPWWASLYLHLKRIETDAVPTMGVDGTYLAYNPEFTLSLTDKECLAVLLHETAHVALLHCYRRKWRDPLLWNLAADQAANALLIADGIVLPKGCVLPGPLDKTAEELYEQIKNSAQTLTAQDVFGEGELGKGDKDSSGKSQGSPEMTVREWKDALASSRGMAPASIARTVEDSVSEVDWRAELAQFLHATTRSDTHTWNRPSRRISGLPGWKREPETTVALCIDTSGSIDDVLLGQFLGEMKAIMSLSGILAYVISCDVAVHQVVLPGDNIPTLMGGGGTDFRSALSKAEELAVDAVVYLTDAQGTFPQNCNLPVLWALTQKAEVPFGKSILIRRTQ